MFITKLVIIFVTHLVNVNFAQDYSGFAFYDDTLIGPPFLFLNGSHQQRSSSDYLIALLAVEGNTDRFNLSQYNGYFLGFQWYNGNENTQTNGAVMFQLYRANNQSAIEGDYTLTYESGWINADYGMNIYYFEEAIRISKNDSIPDSYVIAVMMAKSGTVPVLRQDVSSCLGETNVVLEARLTAAPSVGDVLYFSRNPSSTESCASYSLQGIFAKSDLAASSSISEGCTLYIAKHGESNSRTISSHLPFPGSGFPSGSGKIVCQIIRAEKEDQSLSLNKKIFQLPESDQCLGEVKLQVSELSRFAFTTVTEMGTYCGTDINTPMSSFGPYMRLSLSTSATVYGYQGYQFTFYAKDQPVENRLQGLMIILIVIGVLFLVILIACVCGVVICFVCVKASSSSKNTNTGTVIYPPSNTEMTLTASPNNRLPPLQNSKE